MAKKGLGKGLGTIFGDESEMIEQGSVLDVKISLVEPNKNQPRKNFDADKLEALAQSIKENGLIQPIIVTKSQSGRYTIVAGERRWRAAKLAGLSEVSVIVKEYTDKTVNEVALIENLQREDLNPIEEALGYKNLCDVYKMTQEEISQKVGKSRSAVANSMRLLTLGGTIQKHLINGDISEGHARAALSLEEEEMREFLINRVIESGLNVRQTENLAKELMKEPKPKKQKQSDAFRIELDRIEKKISAGLGTKVKISHGEKKGKIEIEYYGNEDLERLMGLLNV